MSSVALASPEFRASTSTSSAVLRSLEIRGVTDGGIIPPAHPTLCHFYRLPTQMIAVTRLELSRCHTLCPPSHPQLDLSEQRQRPRPSEYRSRLSRMDHAQLDPSLYRQHRRLSQDFGPLCPLDRVKLDPGRHRRDRRLKRYRSPLNPLSHVQLDPSLDGQPRRLSLVRGLVVPRLHPRQSRRRQTPPQLDPSQQSLRMVEINAHPIQLTSKSGNHRPRRQLLPGSKRRLARPRLMKAFLHFQVSTTYSTT